MNPKKLAKTKRPQKTIGGPGGGKFFFVDDNSWRWSYHAIAFKEAAELIIDAKLAAERGPNQDYLAMPVLYLYRHAIELQLKEIIEIGGVVGTLKKDKSLDTLLRKHILADLWTKAKEVISVNYPEKHNRKKVVTVGDVVKDFHAADPDGQTLRYAWNTKGDIHKYEALPSHIHLDHLRATMNNVWNHLEGWHAGISEWWDAGRDAMRGE
jgi:hypothetical protein